MSRRLTAAVFSIALLLACRGTPAPLLPTAAAASLQSPADTAAVLQREIEQLVSDPAAGAGTWGVQVRSLLRRDTLVSVNAHRLLTPASTMKAVTLAVAADQLGWDYTYETRVVATGSVTDGTLNGDLVIVGSGDPSLDDWDGTATSVFRSWAVRLTELGIHAIAGRIIGDGRAFVDQGLGSGWAWDDLAYSYSAPASALQFNEGAAQLVVTPGAALGAPPSVRVSPAYARVDVRASAATVAAGTPTVLTIVPMPRTDALALSGTIAIDASRQVRTVAVASAPLYFARAVREGLIASGIEVRGEAVEARDADPIVLPAATDTVTSVVMTHRSPVLSSVADTMMKLSQNMFAETLLRTLGRERGGAGSADAGLQVVRNVLTSWGVPPAEARIADGSGLSRYNLVTPDAMVTVLSHVWDDERLRDRYTASLPVAGRAGTLSARMKRTAAENNVTAKTGSFSNARAVTGFVRTADGEPLAFSIIANNYGVSADAIDRVSDAIMVRLAEFRRE
jgi:D-alanyl-D-alanine carboxypeptidase/D-alanyl-D-alanine-endopeptidase (penicillin-binding protein 4)